MLVQLLDILDQFLSIVQNNLNSYIITDIWRRNMKVTIELDHYEKDLLIDCIQNRLNTDKLLIINDSLRAEIQDLLAKVEEDCV